MIALTRKMPRTQLELHLLEDRCTPDATPFHLDPSFGLGGHAYITPDIVPNVLTGTPSDAVIRPDGKIWVLGQYNGGSVVARVNPNGTLDTTFNGSGLKSLTPWDETVTAMSVTKLVLLADGSLLLGGSISGKPVVSGNVPIYYNPNNQDFLVMKLLPSGDFDTTFGTNGHAKIGPDSPTMEPTNDYLVGLGVTADGSIVLGGTSSAGYIYYLANSINPTPNATPTDTSLTSLPYPYPYTAFAVARLTAAGQLDTSYGTAGFETISVPNSTTYNTMVVESDGQVVIGGARTDNYHLIDTSSDQYRSDLYAVFAVMTPAGQLDQSVNGTGLSEYLVRSSNPGAQYSNYATWQNLWMGTQADGHITFGMTSYVYDSTIPKSVYEFDLLRVDESGQLDGSYGANGVLRLDLTNPSNTISPNTIQGMNVQPDGSLFLTHVTPVDFPYYPAFDIAATVATSPTMLPTTTLYRFTANGQPDTRLAPDGTFQLPTRSVAGTTIAGSKVFVDGIGRLVVIGQTDTSTVTGTRIGLMRLTQESTNPTEPLIVAGADGSMMQYTDDATGKLVSTEDSVPTTATQSRVIYADVTGNWVKDTITFSGRGNGSQITVTFGEFQPGATPRAPITFNAYESSFTGGINVVAVDLDGNGAQELIVSPDTDGSARIEVFRYDGTQFVQIDNFIAFDDTAFRGGAHLAVGDVNGDGTPDLVVTAGAGGGPRVAIYDGKGLQQMASSPPRLVGDFFAFDDPNAANLRNGVTVTVADLNGDGRADLVFGAGAGGGPRVYALDGAMLNTSGITMAQANPLANFFAGDANGRGGIIPVVKRYTDGTSYIAVTGADTPTTIAIYRTTDVMHPTTTPPTAFQELALPDTIGPAVYVG